MSEWQPEPSMLSAALEKGIDTLSQDREVTFKTYSRTVLPMDGYVFWTPVASICVPGSLHFSQDIEQSEDETVGLAHVVFTTRQKVTEFASVPPNTIFIGSITDPDSGETLRFSFAQQNGRYDEAGIWHYSGRSIYPALESQLLDTPGVIDLTRAVTSNSLALWIALNSYKPIYGFAPKLTLYPADIVEPNLAPPYGAIVIGETAPLSAVPALDANSSSAQAVADRVRLVLYGLQSNEAIDFLNAVLQYSRDTQNFGLMSMPAVVDERRPQTELQAIAMKKTIDFRVSYTQGRVNTVAQKLILSALPTVLVQRT